MSEEQAGERRGLRVHGSMDCRQVFEQAFGPAPSGPTTADRPVAENAGEANAPSKDALPPKPWQDSATGRPRTVP